jgi:hypothetical protein
MPCRLDAFGQVFMNSIDVVSVPGNSVDPEAWDEVLQAVSPEHRFLSHHWYDTWSRTYAANDEDMQPVVYSSTVATADVAARASLFPCVLRHRAGIQVLSMAGYYYPFRTFLCPPDVKDAAINGFVDAIHDESKVAVVLVGPLQTDDPVCDALQNAFRRRRWRLCGVDAGAQQVVQLPDSVEAFRASLSRNLRKNHDRRLRSLESAGEFEISYYNDCSADRWEHAISACAEVESRSWLALDDDGKTRVHGRESFWNSYAAHKDGSQRLSIWVVSLDGQPIAYSLAIDSGQCRYSISGQYDEAYKKHGVGIIADMSMFVQSIESGKTVVNMGDGESDYKRRWGAEPGVDLQSLYIFRPGVIGLLGHTAFRTLERMRHSKWFYRLNRYF